MTTRTPRSYYYAGQGLLWAARLHPETGAPMGYRPMGNCPSVTITPNYTTQRRSELVDGVEQTTFARHAAVSGRLTAIVENLSLDNIAWLAGDGVDLMPAKPLVDYATYGYVGAFAYLPSPLIDPDGVITVSAGGALTPYTDAVTPWDYYMDEDAGLVYLNDGASLARVALSGAAGTRVALTVSCTPREQASASHVPAGKGLWAFIFDGLNDVDGKVVKVIVPMAHLKRSVKQTLISDDVSSMPVEATVLPDLRGATPSIFTVEVQPQGYLPHGLTGV